MTTPVPNTGYATVADFELRTGVTVPPEKIDMVQQRLNDTSAFVELYLGPCADEVEQRWPDILTAVVCTHVYAVGSVPVGVRSESVGATSVAYADATSVADLTESERIVLDQLLAQTDCGTGFTGIGNIGVTWGG